MNTITTQPHSIGGIILATALLAAAIILLLPIAVSSNDADLTFSANDAYACRDAAKYEKCLDYCTDKGGSRLWGSFTRCRRACNNLYCG